MALPTAFTFLLPQLPPPPGALGSEDMEPFCFSADWGSAQGSGGSLSHSPVFLRKLGRNALRGLWVLSGFVNHFI